MSSRGRVRRGRVRDRRPASETGHRHAPDPPPDRDSRANGLAEFIAEVLPENAAMLKVFERCGLAMTTRRERGVVHVGLLSLRRREDVDEDRDDRAVEIQSMVRDRTRSSCVCTGNAEVALNPVRTCKSGAPRISRVVGAFAVKTALERGPWAPAFAFEALELLGSVLGH